MPRKLSVSLALLTLILAGPALGQDQPPGIAWEKDVTTAVAKAKETGRILMICINAKTVDGREREEPAAKGLREVVYLDARIVERSKAFVCVMMSPKSSVADHGVLGNLGVEDPIISPQHIFVSPEGDRVLYRREYWSYGKDEKAIEALLKMMKKAEDALAGVDPNAETPEMGTPEDDAARAEWIASMLEKVKENEKEREAALAALVKQDRDGDCTGPLIELLDKSKKDVDLLKALIRALGRDGLEAAALPISEFLSHRDDSIRGNALVSLEYIGSREKKVVTALMKATEREKDEVLANHAFRALGRCGVDDAGARGLLLKMATNGKSEFATYGPLMGLAYFEGDAKAARGVEKILELIGVPGGGRGGFQNTLKRGADGEAEERPGVLGGRDARVLGLRGPGLRRRQGRDLRGRGRGPVHGGHRPRSPRGRRRRALHVRRLPPGPRRDGLQAEGRGPDRHGREGLKPR